MAKRTRNFRMRKRPSPPTIPQYLHSVTVSVDEYDSVEGLEQGIIESLKHRGVANPNLKYTSIYSEVEYAWGEEYSTIYVTYREPNPEYPEANKRYQRRLKSYEKWVKENKDRIELFKKQESLEKKRKKLEELKKELGEG